MAKLKNIIRTWRFIYSYEKHKIFISVGGVVTGFYPAITAWISKGVIDSITGSTPGGILGFPAALVFGASYGVVTLLQGLVSAYSTVETLNIKDRIASAADQLVMARAAQPFDITAFEIPESRDRIRLASAGGRALPACFVGSIEAAQQLTAVAALAAILSWY